MSDREKSVFYPAYTISKCIEFAKEIDSFKSKTVAYQAVAEKLGLSSITTKSFTQKIGSSKQYGLINTSSSTIQLTGLAMSILYPTSENPKLLTQECFFLPPLYKKLIEEYNQKAIPNEQVLSNILMSKYQISRAAKDTAAKVFLENAEELGFISAGVFCVDLDKEQNEKKQNFEKKLEDTEEPKTLEDIDEDKRLCEKEKSADYIIQTYPVESGKVAKIVIPIDSTEDDLYAIRDLLEVVMKRKFKLRIDD